jgi:hypothetical protein
MITGAVTMIIGMLVIYIYIYIYIYEGEVQTKNLLKRRENNTI